MSVSCLTVGCMKDKIYGHAQDFGEVAKSALVEASGVNSRSFYDPKSGLFFTVLLSLILWWIPYLGQMIPGFVGGRRAGSIKNSLVVSLLASLILIVSTAVISGLLSLLFADGNTGFINMFGGMSNGIIAGIYDFTMYLASFATIGGGSLYVNTGAFAMLIAFGVIGGVMSDQARKEIRIIVGQTMSATDPELPRSVRLAVGETKAFETYSDYSALRVNKTEAPAKVQKPEKRSPVLTSSSDTRTASRHEQPQVSLSQPVTSTEVTYNKIPVSGATPSSSVTEVRIGIVSDVPITASATTVPAPVQASVPVSAPAVSVPEPVQVKAEIPAEVKVPEAVAVSESKEKAEKSEESAVKRNASDDLDYF